MLTPPRRMWGSCHGYICVGDRLKDDSQLRSTVFMRTFIHAMRRYDGVDVCPSRLHVPLTLGGQPKDGCLPQNWICGHICDQVILEDGRNLSSVSVLENHCNACFSCVFLVSITTIIQYISSTKLIECSGWDQDGWVSEGRVDSCIRKATRNGKGQKTAKNRTNIQSVILIYADWLNPLLVPLMTAVAL